MSRDLPFVQVDVFTDRVFGGNPLAVVLDGRGLDDSTMQAIAREMSLSETTFLLPSTLPDCAARVRIFTPARELPFAGHPTVGAGFFLADGKDADLRLEETVGTLTVTVREGFTEMEQPIPTFEPVRDRAQVAAQISLEVRDLVPTLPIEIGSAGNRFVFVPVNDMDAVRRATPKGLTEATYIFSLDVVNKDSTTHGRMYAPWQGIAEDPATGSAFGPLAVYLVRHGLADGKRIVGEQGYEMGRPSLLHARVGGTKDRITSVHVGGRCVRTGGGWVDL